MVRFNATKDWKVKIARRKEAAYSKNASEQSRLRINNSPPGNIFGP